MAALLSSIILALSLCADCFAVSACSSVTLKKTGFRQVLSVALVFALVHSSLFALGWLFGDMVSPYVERLANIIGFILLLYVGGSMIIEAIRGEEKPRDFGSFRNILFSGVATSIDALAVGISFSMDGESVGDMAFKAAVLFVITVLTVSLGILGGISAGRRFGMAAEIVGGLVLIAIGVNILV